MDEGTAPAWEAVRTGRLRDGRVVRLAMTTYTIGAGRHRAEFRPHRELEVSCVEAGRGTYEVEGRRLGMAPGDVFLFNSVERHAILRVDSAEPLVNRVLMFDPGFVWSDGAALFDSRYLSVFFRRGPGFSNRIEAADPAAVAVRSLLAEMEREFLERPVDHELMLKVRLLDILVRLNRRFAADGVPSGAPSARPRDLRTLGAALDHIEAHIDGEVRLRDIAAAAHLDPSYFSTFFKRHLGVGPMAYVARRRVDRAVELLCGTDLPVLEIALRVGFRSSTTFHDAFRRIQGRTPTEVRRARASPGPELP